MDSSSSSGFQQADVGALGTSEVMMATLLRQQHEIMQLRQMAGQMQAVLCDLRPTATFCTNQGEGGGGGRVEGSGVRGGEQVIQKGGGKGKGKG